MKKKFNIATLMLATSLAFAGCGNDADKDADKANEPALEEKAEETEDTKEADNTEDKDSKENEDSKEESDTEDKKEESEEDKEEGKEDSADENAEADNAESEGNVILHRSYPDDSPKAFTNVVVATSGDKIVSAFIDEYQYFDGDGKIKAVPNSDKGFGEGAKEGKVLGSKIDNDEPYSEDMKAAGGTLTLMENYNAITDFVKGKTIAELEELLKEDDEKIMDAVSGATFSSTPNLLKYIVETAKDDSYSIAGDASNPDDIELRYALGAPHGEKSFANAVVAVEGDKIIAASIDEYQYIQDGITKQGEDSDFAKGYKDSKVVLSSKLENNEIYSNLMAEKANATTTIKANFEAIENFVAGKTIDEIKETIAGASEGEAIEAVSGATLVDTAGYLQLIVDTVENPINK